MIEVVAKACKGATSALTGNSGSGMFFEYEGDSYLVGTTVWVDSNASSTITFGEIESDMEYKKNISILTGVNIPEFRALGVGGWGGRNLNCR